MRVFPKYKESNNCTYIQGTNTFIGSSNMEHWGIAIFFKRICNHACMHLIKLLLRENTCGRKALYIYNDPNISLHVRPLSQEVNSLK